ncbi:hypothetical protein DDT91_07135 [Algoriphagus sp. AK58]|nr:hypothetical protein [Algoriphagus sp. AK58]
MGKPSRNFREGFFVFESKIRISWKSISLDLENHFFDFLHILYENRSFFKPVFKKPTKHRNKLI